LKLPDYVILTPVGSYHLYALEDYVESILSLRHKPRLVAWAVDPETADEARSKAKRLDENGIPVEVIVPEYGGAYRTSLERITIAREVLRAYALSTSYDWFLYINSDIMVHPDLPGAMLEVALKTKTLCLIHGYYGREKLVWHGGGIILAHRNALTVSRFMITYFYHNGRRYNVSEDYNFKALLHYAEPYVKSVTGWYTIEYVDILPVKHCHYRDKPCLYYDVHKSVEQVVSEILGMREKGVRRVFS